ncbi:glycosyltransferase family 2 protein [Patescibacteria group bacterium]|nr:glycosyltransferase family 2 protein [Patescibacteria group bacterium]
MISVVVPVFNEEKNVALLYTELTAVLEGIKIPYEIICVDDGSTDNTFQTLSVLNEKDDKLKVIKFRRNFGQTAALSAGFDYAKGDIVVSIDADLENRPENIKELLRKINDGYDIVCGWRYKRWGGGLKNRFLRRVPSEIANYLVRKITKLDLHDTGCTLRAYKKYVVKDIKLYGDMHRFIPAIASLNGAKIAEIKVDYQPRKYGVSKYGFSRTFKVFLDLILLKFLMGYATKPSRFFGLIGFCSGFLGFLVGVYLTYEKLFLGHNIGNRPLLLLSAVLMILGVQFITMGILAEIIMRTYYESQGKKIYYIKEVLG